MSAEKSEKLAAREAAPREENPFEDEKVAKQWINSVENEEGRTRELELYPMFSRWAEEARPHTIVDIGAGQGICADVVQKQGGNYIGVEPSHTLVDRANELYRSENRTFIVGNAYALPLEDATADAALSVNVWFHLADLGTASKELSRVLEPEGKFLVCTANPDAYDVWLGFFEPGAKVDGKVIDGAVNIPVNTLSRNIFFRHSMEEMKDAFRANGLVIDDIVTNGARRDRLPKPIFVSFFGHKE